MLSILHTTARNARASLPRDTLDIDELGTRSEQIAALQVLHTHLSSHPLAFRLCRNLREAAHPALL